MTWATTGGESRQKISLQDIISGAVEELTEIETSQRTQSQKTKLYKRLSDKIKTALHEDGRKKDEDKVALTTYKRYLTKVRNAIKDAGFTHHSLTSDVAREGTLPRVMKDYPEYADLLAPVASEPAETIGARIHEILKTIQADKGNKRRSKAYAAVKAMKTDHEVLYHLIMDDVQKADLADHSEAALIEKKTNTVSLAYADIQAMIKEGLQGTSYTKQAFSLALASGRRAIEILFNADFQKTGENRVMFDGQAKKQAGIEVEAYEIYTLIPADDFLKAFAAFRKLEPVAALHADFGDMDREQRNTEINRRTAKTMNEAAKSLMKDDQRMFKDSRAIYTRICIDQFWKTDEQWKDADEDVFAKHLLGHGDYAAQAHYKQFKIDYTAPASTEQGDTQDTEHDRTGGDSADGQQQTAKKKDKEPRDIAALTKTVEQFVNDNPTRDGLLTYHHKAVEWMLTNPDKKLSQTALQKQVGGNRQTIKDYLGVIAGELETYNEKRG